MVQFFTGPRSQRSMNQQLIGEAIGQGVGNVAQRYTLQNYLNQAEQQATNAQNPLQSVFALMRAGANIPGSEKYFATLLPLIYQQMQMKNLQNANIAGGAQGAGGGFAATSGMQGVTGGGGLSGDLGAMFPQEQMQPQAGTLQNPQGLAVGQKGGFYPNVVGGQEAIGNLPLPSTAKVPKPILSGDELIPEAQRLSREANIPLNEAMNIKKEQNAANAEYNRTINDERKQQKAEQRDYGKIAEDKLLKVYPEASDEIIALSKKWAEEAAGKSQSEATTEREIAAKATKFKNLVSNIEKSIPPARTQNILERLAKGQTSSFEQTKSDIRNKLKPLLDEDLYDTCRAILSKVGYYPEEREMLITDLGETAKKTMGKLPKLRSENLTPQSLKEMTPEEISNFDIFSNKNPYPEEKINKFTSNLHDVLTSDPNSNLILLRREYEMKKGVDWRLFKDGLNNMIESGDWTPNDDQQKQLDLLENPPVAPLYKLLHDLNIIGR